MKFYTIDGNYRLQFGRRMVALFAKSPTLMQDLMMLRKYKIRIIIFKKGLRAFFIPETQTIILSRNSTRIYKATATAHEFAHALLFPTQPIILGKTGRQEFIEHTLHDETEAYSHENIVMQELINAGVKVPRRERYWLNLEKKGGKAAIRKKLETTITSNTREKYPDYYGRWYDKTVPKSMQLP